MRMLLDDVMVKALLNMSKTENVQYSLSPSVLVMPLVTYTDDIEQR